MGVVGGGQGQVWGGHRGQGSQVPESYPVPTIYNCIHSRMLGRIVRSMSTVPRIAAPRHAASPRRWVSEELFDFWGTRLHPLWTLRRPLARLVSRTAESADAVTLVLKPNRHFRGLLPGQHITLGVEVDGRRLS